MSATKPAAARERRCLLPALVVLTAAFWLAHLPPGIVAARADDCRVLLVQKLDLKKASSQLIKFKDAVMRGYYLPQNYIEGYHARRIEPYLSRPDYLEVKNPSVLYRGMYLTIEQLVHILQFGFELDLVRWIAVGGPGIYFSSSQREAVTYIFHSGIEKYAVGAVFVVRKKPAMELMKDAKYNPTNTIFKSAASVPAGDIADVYLWGRYGPENLTQILRQAASGKIAPHGEWTGQFNR